VIYVNIQNKPHEGVYYFQISDYSDELGYFSISQTAPKDACAPEIEVYARLFGRFSEELEKLAQMKRLEKRNED